MARNWTPEERALAIANAERRMLELAAPGGNAKPPTDEIGYSGQPAWGGRLSDFGTDHILAWQTPARWRTIAKMVHDADVAAVLSAITLPVLSTPFEVEAGSEDPEDQVIAETIRRDLDNMKTSLAQHRAETLRCVAWGNALFEIVFNDRSREDGLYHPRKFALRPASTILHWHEDSHGGPDGVTQSLNSGTQQRIEMERLMAFVYGQEGGSLIGNPLTREMYGPWLLKTQLSKVGAIAVERHGSGVPVIRSTTKNPAIHARYEQVLMGIHAHEQAFALLTDLESMADFEIKGVHGTVLDPLPQLEFHRRGIYQAALAQFLLLGSTDVGSFALSEDQSGFFLLAVDALIEMLDDTYNRYLIPRWVSYNWSVTADRMPRVKHGKVNRRNVAAWFAAVEVAFKAGIQLDPASLAKLAASLLGLDAPVLPSDPDPAIAPVSDVNSDPSAVPSDDIIGTPGTYARGAVRSAELAGGKRLESTVKLEALGIPVNFARMTEKLNTAQAAVVKRVGALQAKQARRVQAQAIKLVKAGDPTKAAEWFGDPANIPADEEQAAFEDEAAGVYLDGYEEVWEEIDSQGAKPTRPDNDRLKRDREALAAAALFAAFMLRNRMATAGGAETIRQIGGGGLDSAALADAITAAGERLLGDLAGRLVNSSLGMGRGATIEANTDKLASVMLSAEMDLNTCPPCADLDGTEYPADEAPTVPLDVCEGGNLCRCQVVAVVSDDAKAEGYKGGLQPDELPGW